MKKHPALRLALLALILAAFARTTCLAGPNSFAYVLQADTFAKTKASAIQRLAATDRDWIVLDAAYAAGNNWTAVNLATIRKGKAGRKMIAYLSIGEAEDYRSYWQPGWTDHGKLTASAPAWLLPENPAWPGNFRVKYWDPAWQAIMLAAVDRAIASGFDGVYLDIVDGFETFEQNGNDFIDDRVNPETNQTYRQDMIDWVKRIAAKARTIRPQAIVIPQNGSQLLTHADFINTITAIGIEDLFTDDNRLQPVADTRYRLSFLRSMTARKKPVLIIEYPTLTARKNLVANKARYNGFTWLITSRELQTLGTSGR